MKTKRVGTVTAGISLILFGTVFLIYTITNSTQFLSYALSLWPCILIVLGFEIIISMKIKCDVERKVDFASLALMFMSIIFAYVCELVKIAITYQLN